MGDYEDSVGVGASIVGGLSCSGPFGDAGAITPARDFNTVAACSPEDWLGIKPNCDSITPL